MTRPIQVDYAPVQTFSGKAQGTWDNVHNSHFDLRTPGPSFAPRPALTLDPLNFPSAPKSPRTALPYVRYNAANGHLQHSGPSTYEDAAPGSTARTFTSITGITEENAERERFRRAHFYPVSEALLQGYNYPPRKGEYHSARELRADKVKHSRPREELHDKFSYTSRPPVANMEYGWHAVAPSPPRASMSAPGSPRLHVPAPPTTAGSQLGDSTLQTSRKFSTASYGDVQAPVGFSQLKVYKPRKASAMTRFADTIIAGSRHL